MPTLQTCASAAARAVLDVPCVIAVTKMANAQANSKDAIVLLTNFVFILSFFFLVWPSVTSRWEKIISGRSPMYRTESTARLCEELFGAPVPAAKRRVPQVQAIRLRLKLRRGRHGYRG